MCAPKFYEYIRVFGFGQQTGVELPGESKGLLRKLDNWSAISIGSVSMGQEVGVTPMQLVTAVSAIANGGALYKAHVGAAGERRPGTLPLTGGPGGGGGGKKELSGGKPGPAGA